MPTQRMLNSRFLYRKLAIFLQRRQISRSSPTFGTGDDVKNKSNGENKNQRNNDQNLPAKLGENAASPTKDRLDMSGYSYWSRIASYLPSPYHSSSTSTGQSAAAASANLKANIRKKKPDRFEVIQKTHSLLDELLASSPTEDDGTLLRRLSKLRAHLLAFPASRSVVLRDGKKGSQQTIPFLLDQSRKPDLNESARQCLALCGHTNPPKGPGIRILAIDGGGTRGVIALECLAALEREAGGKKIHEMFDLVVGVSTGALIGTLLCANGLSIAETNEHYETVSKQLFRYRGVGRFLTTSKNSLNWKNILKQKIGELSLLDSASREDMPKIAIVSCIVNTSQLMPFLFRNYEHPANNTSHYRGSTKYKFWEALLASTAAPTYFGEVQLDDFVHRDGGVLINNPTSIALHEATQLWPNERIQCIVSIGNGKRLPEIEPELLPNSFMDSFGYRDINSMIEAATETETIHQCLSDLLPPTVYYRLNPYTSRKDGYELDTVASELIEQMKSDARLYVRRNREKVKAAAKQLTQPSRRFRAMNFVRRLALNGTARQLYKEQLCELVEKLRPQKVVAQISSGK